MNAALSTLTITHVAISLVGLVAGFLVLRGFLTGKSSLLQTNVFLVATIATSVSGFLFPAQQVTPANVLGVISLVVLGIAVYAYFQEKLSRHWRTAYVVSVVVAQYLNFFVLVVQLFLKVPGLKALAPTQTEPAFAISQLAVLLGFVALGVLSVVRTRTLPNATKAGQLTHA